MIKIMYTRQRISISWTESPEQGDYLAEGSKLSGDNVYG